MMNKKILHWQNSLFKSVDASSLGLFRILFGILMTWQSFVVFNDRFVEENFIKAYYHFPFSLFEFLHLPMLSPGLTGFLFALVGVGAILITIGLFFRIACLIFLISFGYIFLAEKGFYNDYHYLILLINFLLLISNADRWPSLINLRRHQPAKSAVPFWQIFLLRMQVVIVYFYAGVSKLNWDWLIKGEPLHRILSHQTFLGHSCDPLWLALFLSYGGIIMDFILAFLLLTGRGRTFAFMGVLLFNLVNEWIFKDIELFPLLMIVTFVIFLEPQRPREIWERIVNRVKKSPSISPLQTTIGARYSQIIVVFVACYLLIQTVIPLRFLFYPDDSRWSYEGARFAWRVKINAKKVDMTIKLVDFKNAKTWLIVPARFLTPIQLWMDNIPDMMVQFVHYLKEDFQRQGVADPIIYIEAKASLNGRPFQDYIAPDVDMAKVTYPMFSHAAWIVPLKDR